MAKYEPTDTPIIAEPPQATDSGQDVVQRNRAISSLVWKHPEVILNAAAQLQDSDAPIECRLRGASMEPTIAMGARLQIRLGEGGPYHCGDVVAFVLDGGVCVHRVVRCGSGQRSANHLITQGDACLCPDPPIAASQVLGRVTIPRNDQGFAPPAPRPPVARSGSLVARALLELVACLMKIDIRIGQFSARLASTVGQALPFRTPVGGFAFKPARRDKRLPDRR